MTKNPDLMNRKHASHEGRLLVLAMAWVVLAAGCAAEGDAPREPASFSVVTLNVDLGHTPRRIDHLLLSADAPFEPVEAKMLFQHPVTDSVWASDHFGVYGRFTLD